MRNRRRIQRRGPIIIYDADNGITRAFRNIPGITLLKVDRLNLLKVAPGGHVGRFAIWTESAFKKLDSIYGTYKKASQEKNDYKWVRLWLWIICSELSRFTSSLYNSELTLGLALHEMSRVSSYMSLLPLMLSNWDRFILPLRSSWYCHFTTSVVIH